MFDDLETILCLHLVSPALPEAWTTIQKYISSGYAPVFDCRGQFCIEVRRPEVESLQETPPARLPARFDFDSTDSAIDFQTWIDDEFTTALKKERQVA